MRHYDETFTYEGLTFQRGKSLRISHLCDVSYSSTLPEPIEGLPVCIVLHVGTRDHDDDLGWVGEVTVGKWTVFVGALEYYTADDAIKRCLTGLDDDYTKDLIKQLIAANANDWAIP
jgi:hypothetical protein